MARPLDAFEIDDEREGGRGFIIRYLTNRVDERVLSRSIFLFFAIFVFFSWKVLIIVVNVLNSLQFRSSEDFFSFNRESDCFYSLNNLSRRMRKDFERGN